MAQAIPAILQGIEFVVSAVTFVQFIYEEAIQTANMGIYVALKYRRYAKARELMDYIQGTLIPEGRTINESWGWIALYSKGCFKAFFDATERQLNAYREITG